LSAGAVDGIESVGRQVADLDRAVEFYEAVGFAVAQDETAGWSATDPQTRLYRTGAARCRTARMTIASASTAAEFAVVLREFGGIDRGDWSALPVWSLGAAHLGLGVVDPDALVATLAEDGLLRPLTHGTRPIAMPDDLKPSGAPRTPFVTFLDPDGTAIEVQPPRAGRAESPMNVAFEEQGAGFNHVNVNASDLRASERFYTALNVRFPAGRREWFKHSWLDCVFGLPGDGHFWGIVNGETAEASGAGSMLFELIAFKEFGGRSHLESMRFADVNVTSICWSTRDVAALRAELLAAGASSWSDGVVELTDGSKASIVRAPDAGTFIELREHRP
jgi:catechol 2,3-dioxygenase-like lactoylglutathione lyase family enzyme